ncbi:MAG: hypothetical protein RQ847_04300 [Wenzhouxiangellaceae bacterium]|nr:hypothetical protein [Wenzhouxiangellaceae bacterium]
MSHGKSIRTLPVSVALLILAGCDQPIPGETREPRCEARSTAEPGRLNIDTGAEDFAVSDPCRASIHFYIARNTPLREIEAVVGFDDADSNRVADRKVRADFDQPDYWMYSRKIKLEPIEGYSCRMLSANLAAGLVCRGDSGAPIECPEVRVKTSYVFRDFTIDGHGLDVCFD